MGLRYNRSIIKTFWEQPWPTVFSNSVGHGAATKRYTVKSFFSNFYYIKLNFSKISPTT